MDVLHFANDIYEQQVYLYPPLKHYTNVIQICALLHDMCDKKNMDEIFALMNCVTANLRELADDIGTFDTRIANATEKEQRGFSVGNLIMNLESQKQKLSLEFDGYPYTYLFTLYSL